MYMVDDLAQDANIPKITTPKAVIPSIQPLISKGKLNFHHILLFYAMENMLLKEDLNLSLKMK